MRRVDGTGALRTPRPGEAAARHQERRAEGSGLDRGVQPALSDRQRRGLGRPAHPCSIGRTWPGGCRTTPRRVLLERARWLRETTGAKNLCIAGGVALNCVANGRIVREAGFDNVWIQPAAGDDGIAIGCAYYGHLAAAEEAAQLRHDQRLFRPALQGRGDRRTPPAAGWFGW